MNQPPELPSFSQLRITLREISPLIWRRLLVCNDTTLTQLHMANRAIPFHEWCMSDAFRVAGKIVFIPSTA